MSDAQPRAEPRLRRGSLTRRILAVNILAVGMVAGSFFYLDGYRSRLIDERVSKAESEVRLLAMAISATPMPGRAALLNRAARENEVRLRLVSADGTPLADSGFAGPDFTVIRPKEEALERRLARGLDEAIDFVVSAEIPPSFTGISNSLADRPGGVAITLAPDRSHVISASAAVAGANPALLLTDRNARDIRRLVRAERGRLGNVVAIVTLVSILLSLFLGRTIVQPLRSLAEAASRVRSGRDREVVVPRLPDRSDEIGQLARAVSDMSHSLRQRIDATEAFAADVSHELKNPLASLASAVQSLETVKQPKLRTQLLEIIASDVRRLDRLITDISDLSRIDARLTRMRFEAFDLGEAIATLLDAREARGHDHTVQIAYARPMAGATIVMGVRTQIERVIENLLDNAVSFSPPGGLIRIAATRDGDAVMISVDDEGPGIPEGAREAIFERFHSDRPEAEAFGTHSGLGLSIARTIIEGHDGKIEAAPSPAGKSGARLIVRLPAAKPAEA